MHPLIIPTIYATGITLATSIFTHGEKRKSFYLAVFAAVFAIIYWIETSTLLSKEPESIRSIMVQFYEHEEEASPFTIHMADWAKVNMHKRKGAEAFCEAEELCMFLPEDKRDIAYQLFESCVEATAATWMGGWTALIGDLVLQLTKYGIFCCKQADKIRDKLKEAEYHYYMASYYYNK